MKRYEQPHKDSELTAFEAFEREWDEKLKVVFESPEFKQGVDALFAMEQEDFSRLLSSKPVSDTATDALYQKPNAI